MVKWVMKNGDETACPTSVPLPGEGGAASFTKTTAQAKSGKKPNWRCGAPNGNQNARKPVHALSALQAHVRSLKKRARAAIRAADAKPG
jgi:hypothetical protein